MTTTGVTTFDSEINANEWSELTATLYDLDEALALVKTALVSVHLDLTDEDSEELISSRDVFDAGGGTVSDEGILTLYLSEDDNPMLGTTSPEIHVAKITWTWNTPNDGVATGIHDYRIQIVSGKPTEIAPVIDLSGIRMVRTKHMTIESHDPRHVQAARDKENTPLPSFCGLHFCIGTPKQ